MNGKMRRRSCALLGAAAAVLLSGVEAALGAITFDGSSRVTLTHDADVSNGADALFSTGAISVPTSGNLFPVNPYQMNHTFTSGGSNTLGVGSLGRVTNATTASFVLATGTGVTQTDLGGVYPGASSLKFDVNLSWSVGAGGFGPLANGFASLATGVSVGAGGSAELHINLIFENQNGTDLRTPWIVDKVWAPGVYNDIFSTSRVLGAGSLANGSKLKVLGTIEFRASNADSPTTFDALRAEFGGTPPTAIFPIDGSGSWFDRSWEQQIPNQNEPGLLTQPNGVGHRAFFSGTSATQSHSVGIGDNITLGTLDVNSPTPYNFLGRAPIRFETQQDRAVINVRGVSGNHFIENPGQLVDSLDVIVEGSSGLVMDGELSGPGGLTKLGAGRLTLSGINTYSGPTTLAEGTLVVASGEGGSATGNAPVTILGGATLAGDGIAAGMVIARGESVIAPGGDGIGRLTFKGIALDEGSIIELDGVGREFDGVYLTDADTFTFGGNTHVRLTVAGGVEGSHPVIDYNGKPVGDLRGKLTLVNPVQGGMWATLVDDAESTLIRVNLAGIPQWNLNDDGSFGSAGNWLPTVVPSGPTALAGFLGKITGPRTVSLNGNRSVGTMVFDNVNKYTIARGTSGTLSIGDGLNAGAIYVVRGNHEISAPINVGGDVGIDVALGQSLTLSGSIKTGDTTLITKSGAGTLSISGAQGYGAAAELLVNGGTVNLSNTPAAPSTNTLGVTIKGSKVVLGSSVGLRSLVVDFQQSGVQTLDLNSPAAAGPAAFNALRVYAADLEAAKVGLYSAIVNANGGSGSEDGIIDSNLHAGSAIGIGKMSDHVVVRATRVGDVNLDGSVTIADFLGLAGNFNLMGTATWQEGDLNYDRNVTIADFLALAGNFNSSYSGERWEVTAEERAILEGFAAAHGAPEPGTMVLGIGVVVGLLRRRKRGGKHLRGQM
jgi:autotransporter-associated beta strand protein